MYIDTHCHISNEYYEDIDLLMKENKEVNIMAVIISGCDKESIKEGVQIANKYSEVYLTLGYHPSEAAFIESKDLNLLENLLINTPKVIALGEIGLDYYWEKESINKQKDIFRKQLKIAEKLKLPVVIHSRNATEDTINILKEYNVKGVMHCFGGSLETAKIYIKMGYKLGIGGVVTFKNSKLKEVIKNISLDDIVLETDAPYLAPEPFRGKQNSSKYLPYIVACIAEIKEIPEEDVMKKLYQNTIELFDLNI